MATADPANPRLIQSKPGEHSSTLVVKGKATSKTREELPPGYASWELRQKLGWIPGYVPKEPLSKLKYDNAQLIAMLSKAGMLTHRLIAIFNESGGAGKSTLIALMAALYRYVAHEAILIDLNPAKDSLSSVLGIDRGATLALRQALKERDKLKIKAAIDAMCLVHDQTKLRFITNDLTLGTPVALNEFEELLTNLLMGGGSVFVNNGNASRYAGNQASFNLADAAIFVSKWDNEETLAGAAKTMRNMAVGNIDKLRDQNIVVIGGVPRGISKQQAYQAFTRAAFRELWIPRISGTKQPVRDPQLIHEAVERQIQDQVYVDAFVEKYTLVTPSRFFTIPDNPAIAEFASQKTSILDVSDERLGLETVNAILRVLVCAFREIFVDDQSPAGVEVENTVDIELSEFDRAADGSSVIEPEQLMVLRDLPSQDGQASDSVTLTQLSHQERRQIA